ncbi:MAG: GNAT family N-acetyltransferase [Chloroflexi bacterium]|nr:GNAT family N-acetyltransferase [Chloroflexota bacterium]
MTNPLPPLPERVANKRVVIRLSTRSDAPFLQKWWNDPNVMKPGGDPDGMQYDDDDMEAWFQRNVDNRNGAYHYVICLHDPNETPIGEFYITCDDRPGAIEVAILIGETHLWGQGYARDAIETYAATVFASGSCDAMRVNMPRDNLRAIGLFESIGFDVEHIWANGEFQTMILTQAAYEYELYKRENTG